MLLSSGPLFGAVIYDTRSSPTYPSSNWEQVGLDNGSTTSDSYAQSFVPGAGFTTITDIKIRLQQHASTSLGSFRVDIFSDNSGDPGSAIGFVGTGNINSLNQAGDIPDYTDFGFSGLSLPVVADTQYWVVLSTPSTELLNWAFTSTSKPGSSFSEYYANDFAGHPEILSWHTTAGGSGPQQMEISAVPEPQFCALAVALGLAGFALWRHGRSSSRSFMKA